MHPPAKAQPDAEKGHQILEVFHAAQEDTRQLVTGAAAGFDGNLAELSRSTGVPLRTLNNLTHGKNPGSAGLTKLLTILAENPRIARRLCAGGKAL